MKLKNSRTYVSELSIIADPPTLPRFAWLRWSARYVWRDPETNAVVKSAKPPDDMKLWEAAFRGRTYQVHA